MEIDLQLFKNIMREGRHNTDLLDSFSPNQFKSKEMLIKMVNDLSMVDSNSEIVILGGWYGSILIPAFKHVKRITLIDLNDQVIGLAKRRLFNHYKNVDFITSDVESLDKSELSIQCHERDQLVAMLDEKIQTAERLWVDPTMK